MIEGPIKHASSSTPGAVPTSSTQATKLDTSLRIIEEGELIINQTDARVFMKTTGGVVQEIGTRQQQRASSGAFISPCQNAGNLATLTITPAATGFIWLIPFKPSHGFTATALGFNVASGSAGTIDIALFEANAEAANICSEDPVQYQNGFSASTTNTQVMNLSPSFVFSPNKMYYFGFRHSADADCTVRAYSTSLFAPHQINLGSSGQACFFRFDCNTSAGAPVNGGDAEVPGGTSGKWLKLNSWTNMQAGSGNGPAMAART